MSQQSKVTLTTLPQESLRTLEREVAQHFHWRILTSGDYDQPRFVIEKRERYRLVRGLGMYSTFRIIGGFATSESGETTLRYAVFGQPGVPIFQAVLTISVLLVFTFFLG